MSLTPALEAILAVGIGLTMASLLFVWWARSTTGTRDIARSLLKEAENSIVFIFEDETLVDATPRARALLAQSDARGSDWTRLVAVLAPGFPDLDADCADLAEQGQRTLTSADGKGTRLDAEHWKGLARIVVTRQEDDNNATDALVVDAMAQEIDMLRSIGDTAPQLIWRQDPEGRLTWANQAYLDLVDHVFPTEGEDPPMWPPRDLFAAIQDPPGAVPLVERLWLQSEGRIAPQCYEITSVRRDGGIMRFAVDVTPIVDAQNARDKFVQTLTKTFAQLSVGLAVFDRDRRLVLFNPALVDLLHLPAEFLIGRPLIGAFLDRLREARMIPEPKDYASWRHQIEALEASAVEGSYQQNWDLPSGLTYRVTGRPHPDGAIAFLFEDVSEELSLTRRFRSQIDLGQNVLDTVDEAIAAFSASGTMLLSNRAYRKLWNCDGHLGLVETGLSGQLALWEDQCAPSPAWQRFSTTGREAWTDTVILHDGRRLACHVSPLANGDRVVRFTQSPVEDLNDSTEDVILSFGTARSGG